MQVFFIIKTQRLYSEYLYSLYYLGIFILQFFLHCHLLVGFYHISFVNIVVVLNLQSAVVTFAHFLHIVFEAFKRRQLYGVNHYVIAYKSDFRIAIYLTISHHTAGYRTHFRYLEELAYFYCTGYFFLKYRR